MSPRLVRAGDVRADGLRELRLDRNPARAASARWRPRGAATWRASARARCLPGSWRRSSTRRSRRCFLRRRPMDPWTYGRYGPSGSRNWSNVLLRRRRSKPPRSCGARRRRCRTWRSCSAPGSARLPTGSMAPTELAYSDIPHWPASRVVGHAGTLVAGRARGRWRARSLAGRAHFYEGHPWTTVTFAMRVLGRLGVKTLVLTNAAGGINTSFCAGHADGDRRSHQPDGQQPARRAERRPLRRAVSRT